MAIRTQKAEAPVCAEGQIFPSGARYHNAKDKQVYSRGYMQAIARSLQGNNISVLVQGFTSEDCFDFSCSSSAVVASEWLSGWLDGKDFIKSLSD
ncbi:hypothetical protein KFE80_04335 [bacterium SCSIO 12696]|nr:hypothetical protein KFE80_04335 [bacterium SCSIO 12696]